MPLRRTVGVELATVLVLVLALVLVAGCGKAGTEPTAKVTGTVTYNGARAAEAAVTFYPEQGRPASGVTDAEGAFTVSTFASGDGAVLGKHTVTIAEAASKEPPPMPGMPGAENYKPPAPRFPAKYADRSTTPFTATVEKGKKNEFTFDMTD
jgi:hypothetical protein